MTGTKIDVFIVKLQDHIGNRAMLGGYLEDYECVKQHFSTDNDIVDLKEYIAKNFIESRRRNAHIRVYTPPADASGSHAWKACDITDALVSRQRYGYIDLVEKESKDRREKVTSNADESFKSDTSVVEPSQEAEEPPRRPTSSSSTKPNTTAVTIESKEEKGKLDRQRELWRIRQKRCRERKRRRGLKQVIRWE